MNKIARFFLVLTLAIASPTIIAAETDSSNQKANQQTATNGSDSGYTWQDCVTEAIEESKATPEEAYKHCDKQKY